MDQELKEQIEKWRKAGKVSVEAKKYAKKLTKKGIGITELANKIEEKILEKAQLSFPCNIGLNEKAAHYTPLHDDTKVLGNDLVKIDFGAALDGFATDTAFTVDLTTNGKFAEMMKANHEALKAAMKLATPGRPVREIGKAVHEIITSAGFSPIRNLSGHQILQYELHAGLNIPSYDNGNNTELEEDMIIAIEPFATTGEGIVKDGKDSGDFSLVSKKPVRDMEARKLLSFIEKEYNTLPFAERWIHAKFGLRGVHSLRLLVRENIVRNYNELIEVSKHPVSQFENTVLVKDKPEILTE